MLDLITNILLSTETTEITTESNIMDILDVTDGTAELTLYISDAIWILVVLAICFAFFTLLLYIYKFFKNRRDPNYQKNDDDFLDD